MYVDKGWDFGSQIMSDQKLLPFDSLRSLRTFDYLQG